MKGVCIKKNYSAVFLKKNFFLFLWMFFGSLFLVLIFLLKSHDLELGDLVAMKLNDTLGDHAREDFGTSHRLVHGLFIREGGGGNGRALVLLARSGKSEGSSGEGRDGHKVVVLIDHQIRGRLRRREHFKWCAAFHREVVEGRKWTTNRI